MAIENLHNHLLFEFEFLFWQKISKKKKKTRQKTHVLGLIFVNKMGLRKNPLWAAWEHLFQSNIFYLCIAKHVGGWLAAGLFWLQVKKKGLLDTCFKSAPTHIVTGNRHSRTRFGGRTDVLIYCIWLTGGVPLPSIDHGDVMTQCCAILWLWY